MSLVKIRHQIDSVDGEIIGLLSKRAALVTEAGKLKNDEQGVQDPKRVEQVIEKVKTKAIDAGLDPLIAEEVYRTIIGCFMRKEMSEFSGRSLRENSGGHGFFVRKAEEQDHGRILTVLNHYVENSFAAYPEKPVQEAYLAAFLEPDNVHALLVAEMDGKSVGFGVLRRHHRAPTFDGTAEIGYFILPEHTGQGLGKKFLTLLEAEAGARGIRMLLANISSRNENSIGFHLANGFVECGRFRRIGRKFGQDFDVVWMQKFI